MPASKHGFCLRGELLLPGLDGSALRPLPENSLIVIRFEGIVLVNDVQREHVSGGRARAVRHCLKVRC